MARALFIFPNASLKILPVSTHRPSVLSPAAATVVAFFFCFLPFAFCFYVQQVFTGKFLSVWQQQFVDVFFWNIMNPAGSGGEGAFFTTTCEDVRV